MGKLQNIYLILIIALSIFLHFHELSIQEFSDDEASPMLLIDRMWDSISLKDSRFLAYPFLFYHDPYRSIFSGTLLHFFGPDRIILRLPSIIFGLLTLCLLIRIFKKEKIAPWLIILSMISYSLSPLIINDRSGGGDAQTRFLFLLTGYLIWQGSKQKSVKNLRLSLLTWMIGMITMLDTIALLPGIIAVFWKKWSLFDKKILYQIAGTILFFLFYFSAWLILPYLTYKSGFQNYYDNRGLFYYLSRVREGVSISPFESFKWLINYTSLLFTLWIIGTFLFAFRIKKFLLINFISASVWIITIFLNRPSFHIIMYAAFLFYQAVIITDYAIKRFPVIRFPLILLFVCIIFTNAFNLFTNYFTIYKSPLRLIFAQKIDCLDKSVSQIYKAHNKSPQKKLCKSTTTE